MRHALLLALLLVAVVASGAPAPFAKPDDRSRLRPTGEAVRAQEFRVIGWVSTDSSTTLIAGFVGAPDEPRFLLRLTDGERKDLLVEGLRVRVTGVQEQDLDAGFAICHVLRVQRIELVQQME